MTSLHGFEDPRASRLEAKMNVGKDSGFIDYELTEILCDFHGV
jgi:hypothetical protein